MRLTTLHEEVTLGGPRPSMLGLRDGTPESVAQLQKLFGALPWIDNRAWSMGDFLAAVYDCSTGTFVARPADEREARARATDQRILEDRRRCSGRV